MKIKEIDIDKEKNVKKKAFVIFVGEVKFVGGPTSTTYYRNIFF